MQRLGRLGRLTRTPVRDRRRVGGAVRAAERGYLQADGINDYGIALDAALGAVAAGVAGEVTIFVRLAAITPDGRTSIPWQLMDTTGSPGATAEAVTASFAYTTSSGNAITSRGFDTAGSIRGQAGAAFTGAGPYVAASTRSNVKSEFGLVTARDGSVLTNTLGAGTPVFARDATHVVFGAFLNAALSPQYQTLFKFVAGGVLNRVATPAEVAAYSASNDASPIWSTAIHAYWAASDVVGTSIPARVGAVPLTLMGDWSASDLVLS